MNDSLEAECSRHRYPPHFVPRWAHQDGEAALVHEGLVVLKFHVHERDPHTGTPTSLSLLRTLCSDPDDSVVRPTTGEDDYWGDPAWKDALARALDIPTVPHLGPPFTLTDVARATRIVADQHLQDIIVRLASEVQVPEAVA